MKELNERELRDVEGGTSLFWSLGPNNWLMLQGVLFCAGFADGWTESKL